MKSLKFENSAICLFLPSTIYPIMTVFQQRATTALIFAAVMLTGLFFNQWSFHLLFLIIATGCVWEFLDMTLPNETYKYWRKIIGAMAGFIFVLGIYQAKIYANDERNGIFSSSFDSVPLLIPLLFFTFSVGPS